MRSPLLSMALLAGAVLPAGCTTAQRQTGLGHHYSRCVDDVSSESDARAAANHALARCRAPSVDYRHGFIQAYVDVAQGASGNVPPVPPEYYWNTCLRDCRGHNDAQQWFAGYAAGAAQAKLRCRPLQVPSNGNYYDNGQNRYPDLLPGVNSHLHETCGVDDSSSIILPTGYGTSLGTSSGSGCGCGR